MISSVIDLSPPARAARVNGAAWALALLDAPVPTASSVPSRDAVGSRAAGTTARETGRDEERTNVAPAAHLHGDGSSSPPPGMPVSAPT